MDNLRNRGALSLEEYAPPYICSYAVHAFNVMNQGKRIYWMGENIPNLRLHVVFVAPPGGMKSYYLEQFGIGDYGIFKNTNIQLEVKQNTNESALIGNVSVQNGKVIKREGEFEKHDKSILIIDEFSGMTEAFKQTFNNQFETQLLAALDHGNVSKSQAAGEISYKTHFTLWGGVQPARYDLARGMGRRMCFSLNLPDKLQRKKLRDAIWNSRNKQPNVDKHIQMQEDINEWTNSFAEIERIDYDESVKDLFEELDIQGFDMTGYERMILGYHLAKHGAEKHMVLHIEDRELHDTLMRQYHWREDIIKGPDLIQLANLIKCYGNHEEDKGYYSISRNDLNDLGSTVQMSVAQIHEKTEEMKKFGMLTSQHNQIILYE